MLATGNTDPRAARARRAAGRRPSTGTWITYVRCHDDIGWAIDDSRRVRGRRHRCRAPAVPLRLVRRRPSPAPGPHGLVFQANPATGDQRISGTAASLAGLTRASRRPRRGRAGPPVPGARDGGRLGRGPGGVERRRAGPAQRPRLGRRGRARGRQPLGAPPAAGLGPAPPPGTTCAPSRAGSSPGWRTSPASAPGCRSCTPRRSPACSTTPTTACSPWSGSTPSGPSSASTTSPSTRRPFLMHRLRAAGLDRRRTTRSAATLLEVGGDGVLWLPAYAAWWVVDGRR